MPASIAQGHFLFLEQGSHMHRHHRQEGWRAPVYDRYRQSYCGKAPVMLPQVNIKKIKDRGGYWGELTFSGENP